MTVQIKEDFNRAHYEQLCDEMKALLQQEKELGIRKEELRKQILEKCGGERMEYGIAIRYRQAKGTVDYRRFVEDTNVDEVVLDSYRKPSREYWEIRSY
jgi:hypothetical protein